MSAVVATPSLRKHALDTGGEDGEDDTAAADRCTSAFPTERADSAIRYGHENAPQRSHAIPVLTHSHRAPLNRRHPLGAYPHSDWSVFAIQTRGVWSTGSYAFCSGFFFSTWDCPTRHRTSACSRCCNYAGRPGTSETISFSNPYMSRRRCSTPPMKKREQWQVEAGRVTTGPCMPQPSSMVARVSKEVGLVVEAGGQLLADGREVRLHAPARGQSPAWLSLGRHCLVAGVGITTGPGPSDTDSA